MPFINVVECDSCGHFHREEFTGDCRDNSERLTGDQLDAHFGPAGWQISESSQ
jgi:hypothetical protein